MPQIVTPGSRGYILMMDEIKASMESDLDENLTSLAAPSTPSPSPQNTPSTLRRRLRDFFFLPLEPKTLRQNFFGGFTAPIHWRRTPTFYIAWLYRLLTLVGVPTYLYASHYHPFETEEWLHNFNLKADIVDDALFGRALWGHTLGAAWEWIGLGTPQPSEGWEMLPPDFPIWRDEIAFVVKMGWEEAPEVVFERWDGLMPSDSRFFDTREELRGGWVGQDLDAITRAMLEVWEDGVWGKGVASEEWVKRMEVLRQVKFLQDEWDTNRTHKRWYILISPNTAPMISSLTFLLSRLNSHKAYYLTFGSTTILSAATVERLIETNAFAGLTLVDTKADEKPSALQKLKTSLGLGTSRLVITSKEATTSWPDAVLQAAAKRRNILINPSLTHHFSTTAPQWTHIRPETRCDILLGFQNLSPSDYSYTLSHLAPEPGPAWPLQVYDLWEKLGGYPSWEEMYTLSYYGRGNWDNVGPTSQNKTRLIYDYWGEEYAEYDDGSWSIVHVDISNDCQMHCYEGAIAPEPQSAWEDTRGKERRCLAYKSEELDKRGRVMEPMGEEEGRRAYEQRWSGLTKCTFVPWKVVGMESSKVWWSMVNDFGGARRDEEWEACAELDGRQFVEPRIFDTGKGTR